jgi:hypothetical protein
MVSEAILQALEYLISECYDNIHEQKMQKND